MILAAHALLQHTVTPTRDDIVEAISGNICRCTGYGQIIEAVEFAADRLRIANTPRQPHGASLDPEADKPVMGAK
jgi:aerobic carbon-monoxide dehydrogenase small subunit